MLPKCIAQHPNLELLDKLVFAVLWTRRNGENKAWPGQKHIASAIGASRRAIVTSIQRLEAAGLVVKESIGKRATNRYYIPDGEVNRLHITGERPSLHKCTPFTSNSKKPYKRTITRTEGTVKIDRGIEPLGAILARTRN